MPLRTPTSTTSTLAGLVAAHPGMRLATAADNALLLRLTGDQPMKSDTLAIGYDRGADYFAFQRLQGERCHTVLFGAPDAEPTGLVTIGIRPGYVDGAPATVALLGDLRLRKDRNDREQWWRFGAGLLAGLREFPETRAAAAYCAVLGGNRRALDVLTADARRVDPFQRVAPYAIVHLFGRLPWARRGASRYEAGPAADQAELAAFLDADQRPLPFGYCFAAGELAFRLRTWPGFSLDNFVVVRDGHGRIRGAAAPWSPGAAKQVVVASMPRLWRLGLNAGAKVLRSRDLPRAGEPLRTTYLTHLAVDRGLPPHERQAVFRALIDAAYALVFAGGRPPQAVPHALAFADFAVDGLAAALNGYIQHSTPAHILVAAAAPVAAAGRVGLEMALI